MLDNETISNQKVDSSSDTETQKFLNCLENAEDVVENKQFNDCIKKAKTLFCEKNNGSR